MRGPLMRGMAGAGGVRIAARRNCSRVGAVVGASCAIAIEQAKAMPIADSAAHAMLFLIPFASFPLDVISTDFRPGRRRLGRDHNYDLASYRVGSGQQHALADFPSHLPRGEIGHDDDLFADQLLRRRVLAQAGADLAFFVAEINLQNQELIRVGVGLAVKHGGHAQIKFGKIVVVYGVGCRRNIHEISC
jgi:hypothetical protein